MQKHIKCQAKVALKSKSCKNAQRKTLSNRSKTLNITTTKTGNVNKRVLISSISKQNNFQYSENNSVLPPCLGTTLEITAKYQNKFINRIKALT